MIYSKGPRSPSFSALHAGNKGSVVWDTETVVEAGLWIRVRSMLRWFNECVQWMCSFLLNMHSAWIKLVSSEFQTRFWCWKMFIQHIMVSGEGLVFPHLMVPRHKKFYHATVSSRVHNCTLCFHSSLILPLPLPASKTWVIFHVKKFLWMINKYSSTENHLIQLWIDPSSE